jgi:hypothetical protein
VAYPFENFAKHPQVKELQPLIVPPLATKEFTAEVLKKTWRGVYRAISDATDIFVIGYSLPKEDQFARLVLKRAIRSNIHKHRRGEKPALRMAVVNPDDAVAVTFMHMAASEVELTYRQARFEDYVSWLQSD